MGTHKRSRLSEWISYQQAVLQDYYRLAQKGIMVLLNEGWQSFFRKLAIWLRMRQQTVEAQTKLPKLKKHLSLGEAEKISLPNPSTRPELSVVIPVYGEWKHILNCLKALSRNTQADFEVIVVDATGGDEVTAILRRVQNLRIVTAKGDLGIVELRNRGAEASKGAYIVFMSSDTVVCPGWLPPMTDLIRRPEVGAVGCKLVQPNGYLLGAGGIVWRDATTQSYGYGEDPQKPQYTYTREVDYCPASCLLVKADLFREIGGFDPRFRTLLYQDSDLCFSLRALGYKVLYQPLAVAILFGNYCHILTMNSQSKKYTDIDRAKFEEKWYSVLQKKHHNPDCSNFIARDRKPGRQLLFIDHSVPTWDKDGGSLTSYSYIRLFSEMGFRVTFLPDNRLRLFPYTQKLQQMGIEVLYGHFNFSQWIRENGRNIDLVWLTRPETSIRYLADIKQNSSARIFYYTQDLHYLREQRKYAVAGDKGAMKKASALKLLEFSIFDQADVILTPSDTEKDLISREFPHKRVEVVPAYFVEELTDTIVPFDLRRDILFLGSFNHEPNIDAAIFLINEVFPLIKKQLPNVRIHIVGSDPTKEILRLRSENVVVTGYVPDVRPYFRNCRVFAAPLRYGAGVKVKILVSMSYGLPVVTTTIGAEGIGLTDGDNALIADDKEELAEKITMLYNNQVMWYTVASKALDTVRRRFSYDRALNIVRNLVG